MKRLQMDQQRLVKEMVSLKNNNEVLKKQVEDEWVWSWRVM